MTFRLYILLIFVVSCTDKPLDRFSTEEKELIAEYPSIFKKFQDTPLVFNAFRYLKIDSTTFKKMVIERAGSRKEASYRFRDLDSILLNDYGITTTEVEYPLYLQLFSIRTEHLSKLDAFQWVSDDLENCINYIRDTLKLKTKIPEHAYRKAMQRVLEKWVTTKSFDTTGLEHVDLFLFREPTINRQFIYFSRNDSIVQEPDAFWYLSGYRDIIVKSGIDTSGIFPVKINFDTAGRFISVKLRIRLTSDQAVLLDSALKKRTNAFRTKLVNNKPLSFSFILVTPSLRYRDEKHVNYP